MNTSNRAVRGSYDNANSGALFPNGGDKLGPIITGSWENAGHAKLRLGITADVDGVRNIALMSKEGKLLPTQGLVTAVRGKGPAYRGNLGKLAIVLWDMGDYYQVRIDKGVPTQAISTEAEAFFGTAPSLEDAAAQLKASNIAGEKLVAEAKAVAAETAAAAADDFEDDDIPF